MDQPASADAAAGKPVLAFVHIPRTGGGTFSAAIARSYAQETSPGNFQRGWKSPGNYQRGPEKTRQALEQIAKNPGRWEAVGDHIPYGLFRRYLPARARYITVLRDPVDRVLSHYHFHAQAAHRDPGSAGERKLRNKWETLLNNERLERDGAEGEDAIVLDPEAEFSLEEGLRRKIVIYDNFMTRFLWGGESLYGELPPDAVERAKENLSTFWFVAFRERLDDSIVLLGRKLGVGLMPYVLRHVSQTRPPLDDVSDDLRDLIAEHNALDVELYRFAQERFEQEFPSSSELADDVRELRARSAEVTKAAVKAREEKKEAYKAQERAKKAESDAENEARKLERGGTKEERRAARGGTKADRKSARGGTKAEVRAARGDSAAEKAPAEQASGTDGKPSSDEPAERTRRVKPKTKGKANRRASATGDAPAATEDAAREEPGGG